MAVSKDKKIIAISLDKNVIKIMDDIVKASPQKMTRSDVVTFAIAEFYLSILEAQERGNSDANN